jgi:hypothetical protein
MFSKLFETCVETLLNTMFIFDESPPQCMSQKVVYEVRCLLNINKA